jgi:hypothetical protein
MKRSIYIRFLLILFSATCFVACKKDKDPEVQNQKVNVRYIEQICCGNLVILENVELSSSCETYKDSLLRAVNLDAFSIAQNYQFGDKLSIEFRLTENCEASCEITCNRMNGIPIELVSVE